MNVHTYLDLLTKLDPYLESLELRYDIAHPAISLNGVLCQVGDLIPIKEVAKEKGVKIKIDGKDYMQIATLSDAIDYFSILSDLSEIITTKMHPGLILFYPTIPANSILKVRIDARGLKQIEKMLIQA